MSFAFTKCEVDNVRGAVESEKSCDKMLHNPVTKGHLASLHVTLQISIFPISNSLPLGTL